MEHGPEEFSLLKDIVTILGSAVVVILLFQRFKIPTIVGFLITGILIGPYGFQFISAIHEVELLAEIGVILLLFVIGLEFSLKSLAAIRKAVLLGGASQVLLTTGVTYLVFQFFGYSFSKSVFLGFLLSLSSTAIVMKMIQDKNQVNSPQGKISLAILIFQDIIVVPMMLFTPFLAGQFEGNLMIELSFLLLKVVLIIVFVIVAARYVVPKLLYQVARSKSKELFILAIVVICFAVAWLTSMLGLSLALGAFMAGLIISESEYSHQATSNILPFREIFTSFFFVSIGMLLDFMFLLKHFPVILGFTLLVFLVKGMIAASAALILRYPFRIGILVGFALFQVGEFAFILSEAGMQYGLLSPSVYQYFLSVSILSMAVTPFIFNYGNRIADNIARSRITKGFKKVIPPKQKHEYEDHVVIIGYGLNGRNVAKAAKNSGIPYVIIEMNADTVVKERAKGEPIFYGDAVQDLILSEVNISKARVAVIAISDPDATKKVIVGIRDQSKHINIIVRTRFINEIEENMKLGADEVIPEEFETSIEIFTRVLQKYLVPMDQVEEFVKRIRSENYEMFRSMPSAYPTEKLDVPGVELNSYTVQQGPNVVIGKTLEESQIRNRYGVTLVAVKRNDEMKTEIGKDTRILQDDIIYVFGKPENLKKFEENILIK